MNKQPGIKLSPETRIRVHDSGCRSLPGGHVMPAYCPKTWFGWELSAFLQDLGDRFDDAVNVAAVECRDADAPGTDRVDAVLVAQAIHLL